MAAAGAILGVGSSLLSADQQAKAYAKEAEASRRVADFQAETLEQNARFAEESALDSLTRGELEAERLHSRSRGLTGSQRASFAGQGVDVGSETALAVQDDVTDQTRIDADMLRSNAMREAMGIRHTASQSRQQAAFARATGKATAEANETAAKTSLATGGLKAVSTVMDYRRTRAPKAK